MEATGWENIRTRALLLGMSPREIDGKIESIAEFTKLGEFLDIPVRHYSTGMFVRLAFATSTAVDPQILLLDEVMAAGDKDFINSARQRMNELMERASIVLFATHSLDVLPKFCERTILLSQGAIVADGPTEEVVQLYTASRHPPPRQTHELRDAFVKPVHLFVPTFRVDECLAEVRECLERGWTGLGYKTIEFERRWTEHTGLPHAHLLNSATSGLHLAVRLLKERLGWNDGDEIISTPLTFVSSNHAILYEQLRARSSPMSTSISVWIRHRSNRGSRRGRGR